MAAEWSRSATAVRAAEAGEVLDFLFIVPLYLALLTNQFRRRTQMDTMTQAIAAIQQGNAEILQQLLSENATLRSARDPSGVSLLMLACYHRRADLANLMAVGNLSLDIFEAAAIGRNDRLCELCC